MLTYGEIHNEYKNKRNMSIRVYSYKMLDVVLAHHSVYKENYFTSTAESNTQQVYVIPERGN